MKTILLLMSDHDTYEELGHGCHLVVADLNTLPHHDVDTLEIANSPREIYKVVEQNNALGELLSVQGLYELYQAIQQDGNFVASPTIIDALNRVKVN